MSGSKAGLPSRSFPIFILKVTRDFSYFLFAYDSFASLEIIQDGGNAVCFLTYTMITRIRINQALR